MSRPRVALFYVFALSLACSSSDPSPVSTSTAADSGAPSDAGAITPADASPAASDADLSTDAGAIPDAAPLDSGDASTACAWSGAPGQCLTLAACAALPKHSSYAGQCPGPASIECCITTPDPANDPPTPTGYKLMQQSEVTTDMTTWAVAILDDPATYPMFATTTKVFGALTVLARVEWHPPDFQNGVIHRGVTLYEPI